MNKLGVIFSIFFGTLMGITTALIWMFGFINLVKPMIPYALFFVVLTFIATAVLKAKCGRQAEGVCTSPTCKSVNLYTPLIMITAAIFIVFGLFVLATILPLVIRTVFAFIGSIAFWVMLFSFVFMIIFIIKKCCK